MRFIFVRHGESEGNIDDRAYIEKGDAFLGLTEKGWSQAEHAGAFLRDFYARQGNHKWPHIFCSGYQRTRETLSDIYGQMKQGGFEGSPKFHEDVRLTEQFYGAMAHLKQHNDPATKHLAELFQEFSKKAYKGSPVSARLPFGESPKDIILHTKSFMEGTLSRDISEGKHDILIVAHGAIIKAFLMNWFHLPLSAWNELALPGNGDILSIEGEPKSWKARKIFDGQENRAVDLDPIANIKRLNIENLPKKPDFSGPLSWSLDEDGKPVPSWKIPKP